MATAEQETLGICISWDNGGFNWAIHDFDTGIILERGVAASAAEAAFEVTRAKAAAYEQQRLQFEAAATS